MNTYISLLLLLSRSVISNSLWPHGLQHPKLPCPSLSPRACLKSCSLSHWYHPTISSSVIPFSSCLQSFPASGSFPVSQFFTSGGQSIGASASASVLPMNIQDWFPFGLTGLISLESKGLLRVFSNTTVQKHQFFSAELSLWSNSHIHTWHTKQIFLPWWLRQWRICLSCRKPGFNPWVRKIPRRRNRNPPQYSCLGNPMNRGAWQAAVHGVTKSQTQLSN